jgi:hypothetical protein
MFRRLVFALGLDDGGDSLSFNKTVTAILCALVVYLAVRQYEIGTHLLVLAICVQFSGYGFKGLRLFSTMYKRTDSVNLTGDAAKVIEAIRARRDDAKGIDPA